MCRRKGRLVPAEGLEPPLPCEKWILSPPRLPFRHAGTRKSGRILVRSGRARNRFYQREPQRVVGTIWSNTGSPPASGR